RAARRHTRPGPMLQSRRRPRSCRRVTRSASAWPGPYCSRAAAPSGRAPGARTAPRRLNFSYETPLLGLFGRSEHLAHLALLFQRQRIRDLLRNDHAVGRDRPDLAVEQPVTSLDDVGLVVGRLQDADVAALADERPLQRDFAGL